MHASILIGFRVFWQEGALTPENITADVNAISISGLRQLGSRLGTRTTAWLCLAGYGHGTQGKKHGRCSSNSAHAISPASDVCATLIIMSLLYYLHSGRTRSRPPISGPETDHPDALLA